MEAKLLWKRFVNREDSYAVQWVLEGKGSGYAPVRYGKCTHDPPHEKKKDCPDSYLAPIKLKDIQRHLDGDRTLGIYQLNDAGKVKWICFDVDINKRPPENLDVNQLVERVREHTVVLAQALVALKGKNTFLVEYTGNKGYHIWIFFDKPVEATLAQSVGSWLSIHNPAPEGTHVEVFPKQTSIAKFGNLVKLPLGIHKKTGRRCLFVDYQFRKLPDQYHALTNVETWTEDDLRDIIDEYEIRPEVRTLGSGERSDNFVCMQNIMAEGLQEGSRDAGIYRLALWTKDRNIPQDVAFAMAQVVNDKTNPPLDEETIADKIESAYVSDYSPFPCSDELIHSYCSSSCRFWQGKVKNHWTRYGRKESEAIGVISRD